MSKWIKCSDKMPPNGKVVLGTVTYHGETVVGTVSRKTNKKIGYTVWKLYEWNAIVTIDKVVAWQELPEPYKEGKKEGKNEN